MAYTKTQWVNNEEPSINATNLNKMEQGIADAQFPDGGLTGQMLVKTDTGYGWADDPNSAQWGNITGQLSEQTDLYSELQSKIASPSGGTTGQYLQKTASGTEWATAPTSVTPGSIATVESAQTTQNHAVGDYVLLNGQLYVVTAAVNTGETFVEGTNISAAVIGDALTALNNGLMTFTPVSAVSNRATGLSGGYAYLNGHTVFVQIIGTMNLKSNNSYEFALIQGLPIPWSNAALSLTILNVGSLNGFASTARVGTDGIITASLSKAADTVYGKTFCLGGIYYVN